MKEIWPHTIFFIIFGVAALIQQFDIFNHDPKHDIAYLQFELSVVGLLLVHLLKIK